ncbi:MAG: TldD/PmbA family protein [Chloroflexi bacterium]|nr:TldD/PmbA family protein [Chloroflexota bacterium]MDA1270985.1 TldD/PmbA family protein [Chloroflexota bacterium]
MAMDDLVSRALDLAEVRGAGYCDVRLVETHQERAVVRNGVVDTLSDDESLGIGVRVLVNGSWGFASSNIVSPLEVDRITGLAVEIAKASARSSNGSVSLGPPVTSRGRYTTPIQTDPFTVSPEVKLGLLLEADRRMGSVAGISARTGNLIFIREQKTFANSEGAHVEQTIYEAGGGIAATARGNGEVQRRSYPQSMRQQGCAGWEFVAAMDLAGNAERTATEAVALLSADQCPSGVTTLIVGASQLGLQVHESCGHAIELDRVLGSEAAYAGTSFLTTDKLNDFQYGSSHVNITADSIRLPGLGSYGWDDEGVPAQSTPVVRNGRFEGYLTSRETANGLGLESNGSMRASSWNRIPLIRMTNVSLEPGDWTLDDLIADTDEGILMEMNRSWSIDDRRFNFQFGVEIGYEIKKGKLGRMLKNSTYTGITPEFWNSCDAVCNEDHWTMWGIPNCGKGQPGQIGHTGHGAAPARFRNIQVGVMK